MISNEFLASFKAATEDKWSRMSMDPEIHGFQIVPGTRWNPGLPDETIREYEEVLAVRFPNDFRAFLGSMNGTDKETLNIYGSSGEPSRRSVGVYSYPRDLAIVKDQMEDIRANLDRISGMLARHGYDLPHEAGMVPIFSHRFVVCGPDPESSVVLSIVTDFTDDVDAVVYARSLEDYLVREFLSDDDNALAKQVARMLQSALQRRVQRRAPVRPRRRR
jgi:hypothetical protein